MAEKWNAKTAIVAEDVAAGDKLPASDESQTVGSKDRTITATELRKTVHGLIPTIQDKTANYTLAAADIGDIFLLDGTFTITLPNGLQQGFNAWLIFDGTGTITLSASTTLNSTKTTMTTQHESCRVIHVGSDVWHAIFYS